MKLTFVAFSLIPQFDVRFPSGKFHLILHIRDTADCLTAYNLSLIEIQSDSTLIDNLISNFDKSNENPLTEYLSSGNQNIVGQILNSASQQMNSINNQTIEQAISSIFIFIISLDYFQFSLDGIPSISISISPLGRSIEQQVNKSDLNLSITNESALNANLNSQSTVREYLIEFTNTLAITTSNSIKLQSTSLAEITRSTNQLTRNTLVTSFLISFSKEISFL